MRNNWLLCASIVMVVLIGCRKYEDKISSVIADKISAGEGTTIDIAKLTSFDWNRLYIFGPYESRDSLQDIVGQRFLGNNELPLGVKEGYTLFVFTRSNKVIHYFNHPRGSGDFSGIDPPKWFTPQNAKFRVYQDGLGLYGKWLKLKAIE
jgi:hypothetical protein